MNRSKSNSVECGQPEAGQPESSQPESSQVEEQLRKNEAHFRAALESSQTGIWEYDLTMGELLIDGAYGSFYGLAPGPHRLPAKEISKFTSNHEQARNRKIFEHALESGEAFEIEYLVCVPGLPERWLLSRGRPTNGPNGPLVLGTVVDITARKNAESAVHRSETRYRALAEATSQAIWTHPNQNSETVQWWQNLTGQVVAEASGIGWEAVVHPDDREHVLEAWAQSLKKNLKFDLEYRVRVTDGSYRDLAVRSVPVLEPDGVREWIGTISDVTSARQADRDAHFLLGLSELLRLSNDPETLLEKSSRAVCEHIGGSRCTFLELEPEPEFGHGHVRNEFTNETPSMIGRHELLRFGSVLEDLKAGRTVIVNDAEHDPRTAAAFESTYQPYALSACMVIPLLRIVRVGGGLRLVGQLSVGSKTSRVWKQSEISLLETVAERVWNALERVRNETELHLSEERFRTLAVATSNIVWSTNAAGEIASPQDDWAKFTGQTIKEFLGRGWNDAVHPDDRYGAMQSWQENLAHKGTYYHEHRLRRADGQYRDMAVRGVPLLEPDGSVREWVGTMTDITDRKQTARALETQALLLREQADLLALVNETVIVRDPQDNVISWNRAAEEMYGFSRDESIGRVTHDLLETHFQIPETKESVRAILERDGFWEGELTHVRHDGSSIVVLSRQALQRKMLPNSQPGETLAILEVNWDISERKRNEQILRESESRFRWLAEATPQMVCVSDTAGKLSYVNQAYSDYTGINPMGHNPQARIELPEIVHPEDLDSFMLENTQARKNGTTLRHELRIRSASTGQYRWFLHQLVPARNQADEVIWWFGTSTDIHAHKEAELSLLSTLEQQKRFVSDASHEFRAPLTAILGNLGLLERYPNMPSEDRVEAITEATREAGRLGRLVSELLTLARSDAGVQPTLEDVNLREVALEAWQDAHQFSNGCTLEQGVIEHLEVEGNRDRLKQLALILFDNALKYTPKGGTVRLELQRNGNFAELTVTDSGPGILPEDLPHVFERFYRADPSRTHGSDPGGSGLGLPIAQSIAQSHGGEVSLENRTDGGIRALVRLHAIERD